MSLVRFTDIYYRPFSLPDSLSTNRTKPKQRATITIARQRSDKALGRNTVSLSLQLIFTENTWQ